MGTTDPILLGLFEARSLHRMIWSPHGIHQTFTGNVAFSAAVLEPAGEIAQMPKGTFVLHPVLPNWWVRFKERDFGPYLTRDAAFEAAVTAANQAGKRGHNARVVLEDEFFVSRLLWTYGFDSLPLMTGSPQKMMLPEW